MHAWIGYEVIIYEFNSFCYTNIEFSDFFKFQIFRSDRALQWTSGSNYGEHLTLVVKTIVSGGML